MSVTDVLSRVVSKLELAEIPYMIAGSFVSTFYGVPRSTQDIDIVVDPNRSTLDTLLKSMPEDEYYVDADVAHDALRRRSQFNVLDMATGWKIDLILRKARPFSVEELSRRAPGVLFGVEVFMATPEDSIISKLEWAKLSDSDRQLRDVEGMIGVRATTLDLAYIERWVNSLELIEQWQRVTRP
jgi:hypothetical protein